MVQGLIHEGRTPQKRSPHARFVLIMIFLAVGEIAISYPGFSNPLFPAILGT